MEVADGGLARRPRLVECFKSTTRAAKPATPRKGRRIRRRCNPIAWVNVCYACVDIVRNSKAIPTMYKEAHKLVEAMMTIEHFVATVMDVIIRGWDLYQTHWAKMEQKESAEAEQRAARRGEEYEFDPFTEKDPYLGRGGNQSGATATRMFRGDGRGAIPRRRGPAPADVVRSAETITGTSATWTCRPIRWTLV